MNSAFTNDLEDPHLLLESSICTELPLQTGHLIYRCQRAQENRILKWVGRDYELSGCIDGQVILKPCTYDRGIVRQIERH